MLARRALEIHTRLQGAENNGTLANVMLVLGSALDYFNGVDDDEVDEQARELREQGGWIVI